MPSCYRHRKLGIPPFGVSLTEYLLGLVSITYAAIELAEAATSNDFDVLAIIDAAVRSVVTPDTEPLKTSLQ